MGIGERIKIIRGALQQEEFAKKISVSKSTVGRFEREERSPDIEDLNTILSAYPDINPAWLLTGQGQMKNEIEGEVALKPQAVDELPDISNGAQRYEDQLSDRSLHVLIYEAVDEIAEELNQEANIINSKDKGLLASELFRIFSKADARQHATKETMLEQAIVLWFLIGNRDRINLLLKKMGLIQKDSVYRSALGFLALRDAKDHDNQV
jgi:transcriptional regulator with XRE-family HTH domain